MNPKQVRLVVEKGAMNQKEYCFTDRERCIVGRNKECIPLQSSERSVSRTHCELDVNPPEITIRELGSLGGTTINGKPIGKREAHETPEQGRARHFDTYPLFHNDLIELANAVRIRVLIGNDAGADHRNAPLSQPPMPLEQRLQIVEEKQEAESRALRVFEQHAHERVQALLPPALYEVGETLGVGGMGMIISGVHKPTGDRVVFKIILPQYGEDRDSQARFAREFKIIRQLRHPNIVRFREDFYADGVLCLVFDYCDGGSMDHWIQYRGKKRTIEFPTPARAVQVIIEVLKGLEYAHNLQIVHRDLKPGNILMHFDHARQQYVPCITDFGLSRILDETSMTATGAVGGTPEFMPRQQILKFKNADQEVDVWATAAILYWMLTEGHLPRNFPKRMDPIRVVLETSPIKIRERKSDIPPLLAEIVDEALIDSPDIKIRSAQELRTRLERVVSQL